MMTSRIGRRKREKPSAIAHAGMVHARATKSRPVLFRLRWMLLLPILIRA